MQTPAVRSKDWSDARKETYDVGDRPAVAWRSLTLRMALVAVPAWFTVAALIFQVPVSIKLVVGLVLATSLASPGAGLLTVAALAPLGTLLTRFAGEGAFRMTEAVGLAFFTGWLLRALKDRPGPGVPSTIGWLLAGAVAASAGGIAWQFRRYPAELAETGTQLFFAYYLLVDRAGFLDGARLVEGLALAAATVTLFRQRPQLAVTLPMVLAASATAAAASSVLLRWGIAPADILARYARTGYPVSAHVADVNAAGSYFAMMLCLVIGMAARSHGRGRLAWLVAALAVAAGLWLSASRSATAADGAENARNYFLQVGAEFGLLGLALFTAWVGVVLWRALKAIAVEPHDVRLQGAAGGLVVLLGTCLTGHPLLIDDVAFPFWIQFGLVAGLSGSVLLNAGLAARSPRLFRG